MYIGSRLSIKRYCKQLTRALQIEIGTRGSLQRRDDSGGIIGALLSGQAF